VESRREELAKAMHEQARAIENAELARERAQRREDGYLELTNRGLALNKYGEEAFHLRGDQLPRVNEILQSSHRNYLAIEQQHTTRETNDLGHQIITIEKFSDQELGDLDAAFWSEIDQILDVEQQGLMRNNLQVHVSDNPLQPAGEGWRAGVFGWGRYGARIELWKVGTWFHWQARIQIDERTTSMPQGKAPELPIEFSRFWMEETETERSDLSSKGSGTCDS
jgi:hypothetical protein